MTTRVLVVDDDSATCRMIELGLRSEGYEVAVSHAALEALEVARAFEPNVVLTDINLGATSGLELCPLLHEQWPDLPVVVITAFGTMETATLAMRAGAYDFITKPFDIDALALAISRAFRHHQLQSEVKRLRAAVGQAGWAHDLVGTSIPMLELRALLERISQADTTVLVTGETGTGKERVARVLHQHGKRRNGPFVAVNCSALPEAVLESELFGQVRDACTGARQAPRGSFLKAQGGTLFLDEIGAMPPDLQAKLASALEARRVRALGADSETAFDTRIIAATNRDLDRAVREGRFREDLYQRVNVLHVALPPLRSRGGDAIALAQYFLEQFARQSERPVRGISGAAARRIAAYPWPGNVRELRNSIERAVALTRFDQIAADDLPEQIKNFEPQHVLVAGDALEEMVPLEEVERRYTLRVLQAAGGNKSLAAQRLGVSRRTLDRKLGEYGVE
jgi:two-component system response regulator HydG